MWLDNKNRYFKENDKTQILKEFYYLKMLTNLVTVSCMERTPAW